MRAAGPVPFRQFTLKYQPKISLVYQNVMLSLPKHLTCSAKSIV